MNRTQRRAQQAGQHIPPVTISYGYNAEVVILLFSQPTPGLALTLEQCDGLMASIATTKAALIEHKAKNG